MTSTAEKQPSSRFNGSHRYMYGLMLTLSAAATLPAMGSHAQTAGPATAVPAQAAAQTQATQSGSVVASASKYGAKDIERAFSFMDSNKDGKLSREEASGFRGVARHFDEADSNKDNALSRAEFENALSGEKNR